MLETDTTFAAEFEHLLSSAQCEVGDTIYHTGSGAVATRGSTAAGAGGIAIGGNVSGSTITSASERQR